MSVLNKLKKLRPASEVEAKVEMTDTQVSQCKAALKRDNRGPAVQPNKFDLSKPYRVTVNFDNEWSNHGLFSSADVAAAVGTIVSASIFGDKATAGNFDDAVVESSTEFSDWLKDPRNADVLARVEAGTSLLGMRQGNTAGSTARSTKGFERADEASEVHGEEPIF